MDNDQDLSNLDLSGEAFTIMLYFHVDTLQSGAKDSPVHQASKNYQAYLMDRENDYAIIYGYEPNSVEFFSSENGSPIQNSPRAYSKLTVTETGWQRVVYTYDGTTFKAYLNNSLVHTKDIQFTLPNFNPPLTIGAPRWCNTNHYKGKIGEVQIYNGKALTESEIFQYGVATKQPLLNVKFENVPNPPANLYGDTQFTKNLSWPSQPWYYGADFGFFDGVDDYMVLNNTDHLDLTNQFTFIMTIDASTIVAGEALRQEYLLHKTDGTTPNNNYAIIHDYKPRSGTDSYVELFSIGETGTNPRAGSAIRIPNDGTINQIAYTYDRSTFKGYLNGIEQFSHNRTFSFKVGNGPLYLGATDATQGFFQGSLDDVFIYDHALTENDIQRHKFGFLRWVDTDPNDTDSDLYTLLKEHFNQSIIKYTSLSAAISAANPFDGVFIETKEGVNTVNSSTNFSNTKNLRFFVEYPQETPGTVTQGQRGVITHTGSSNFFSPDMMTNMIVELHQPQYQYPLTVGEVYMRLGKAAGFRQAVYGITADVGFTGLLYKSYNNPNRLNISARLSNFKTVRYMPHDRIQNLVRDVLMWLSPTHAINLSWTDDVAPTFPKLHQVTDTDLENAIKEGAKYTFTSKMLYNEEWDTNCPVNPNDPSQGCDEAHFNGIRLPYPSQSMTIGDGSQGMLETPTNTIRPNGEHFLAYNLRTDSQPDQAYGLVLSKALYPEYNGTTVEEVAENLVDWDFSEELYPVHHRDNRDYFISDYGYTHSDRVPVFYGVDPDKGFSSSSNNTNRVKENNIDLLEASEAGGMYWFRSHSSDGSYQANDDRIILGSLGTAAELEKSKWNTDLAGNLLMNYRTTSKQGLRGENLEFKSIHDSGWFHYSNREAPIADRGPHYESWMHAANLWYYSQSGYAPMLYKSYKGLKSIMDKYETGNGRGLAIYATNGIQQERAHILLPLAWYFLHISDDGSGNPSSESYQWVKLIVNHLYENFDPVTGAIREEVQSHQYFGIPLSNFQVAGNEFPVIHNNGEPVTDGLYTINFLIFVLNELKDIQGLDVSLFPELQQTQSRIAEMTTGLKNFFVKTQINSTKHPKLDGGWYRATDYERWEYFGTNADKGWGPWVIQTGGTQGWVLATLNLIKNDRTWWEDVSNFNNAADPKDNAGKTFNRLRTTMLPDQYEGNRLDHDGMYKTVTFSETPNENYPNISSKINTERQTIVNDGFISSGLTNTYGWVEFNNVSPKLEITIDLGAEIQIDDVAFNVYRLDIAQINTPNGAALFKRTINGGAWTAVGISDSITISDANSGLITFDQAVGQGIQARELKIELDYSSNSRVFIDEFLVNSKHPSMVAHWTFDAVGGTNASPTTVWSGSDASEHNHTLTQGAGTKQPEFRKTGGWMSGALKFDGNDYLSTPHATDLNITNKFTFAMAINPDSFGPSEAARQEYLLDKNSKYAVIHDYITRGVNGESVVELYSLGYTGSNPRTNSQIEIPDDGQWHHITYTYDGTTLTRYLDGKLYGTAHNTTFSFSTSLDPLYLGAANQNEGGYNGKMDDVYIFNRALSADEVLDIYSESVFD